VVSALRPQREILVRDCGSSPCHLLFVSRVILLVMTPAARSLTFRSLDGLTLHGTLVEPATISGNAVVLVHGGGATREETGFFTRLATGLAEAGLPSLRFDLRGHGESEGRQEDLTLAGVVNDIRAAVEHVREVTSSGPVGLIGASFSGGLCAYYTTRYPATVARLVLLNPLLNYKKRFVEDKPYWHGEHIDAEAGHELAANGFIPHNLNFKLGRALFNEVFYLQPHLAVPELRVPTLFVHGTRDTFVPVESSRTYSAQVPGAELLEIPGAQHGFAVMDDPQYANPQSQAWQAEVIGSVAGWLTRS
jgi:uncharacterized protein